MCRSNKVIEHERVIRVHGGTCEYTSLGPQLKYPDNNVISSKYTWYSFIPKNLSEQFSNLANLYFLLVGILQIIPQVSTTGGMPTMYQPLAFIVLVSAARALSEDISKHRADNKRNSYQYDVLRYNETDGMGEWARVSSGNLAVGDIVRVRQNEMIPTDMLFLGSSLPQGHCFIDKANLNGETKLEVYSSIRETRYFCPPLPDTAGFSREEKDTYLTLPPPPELLDLQLELAYELPNKRFDSFRGMMLLNDEHGECKQVRCDGHTLLMRETNLKNTDFIYGLVVYTGNDTKIQRSNLEGEKAKVKVSHVMRQVNNLLKYMFLVQAILCFVGGLLAGIWAENHGNDWYMYYNDGERPLTSEDAVITGVLAFFTWYINLSQMVPISLIVSGEMVKFIMSIFINMDVFLYHEPIQKSAKCNSSTIHEDLGLVDYVFSDKTGTLTQNKMEFRYALVNDGSEYGSRQTEIAKAVQQRNIELEERANGTYKPKAATRWTELLRPYVPHRQVDPVTHYDEDCCVEHCPRVCWGCWMNNKPGNDTVHSTTVNAYMDDGDDNQPDNANNATVTPLDMSVSSSGIVSNPSGISKAEEDAIADANCFSKAERRLLLSALYGPKDPNMSEEQHQQRKEALHLYMLHMTLSNTVKPFMENGELQFQPESAEELAMVQFAQKCGYTKLPEKEEKEKTEEEKQSNANTRMQIQKFDELLQPIGEPEIHCYAFLACLGFTSARARVTVIYQEASTGNILVMMKGQDTTVLPFLDFSEKGPKFEEALLSNLTDCCNNGLRTLVSGHSTLPATWWDKWGPEYSKIKDMTDEDEEKKKKLEHELFEQIERDSKLTYLGCIGMEDQLQPLVPECIQSCLRAGVKVWMITGDKLETARNIGLACNLIDADMQPQIKAGQSLSEAMAAFADSRLIQVTGEWNSMFENREELGALFDNLDYNKDGFISVEELRTLLHSLHSGISESRIEKALTKLFTMNESNDTKDQVALRPIPTTTVTGLNGIGNARVTSSSMSTRERGLDKEGFMLIMRQFKRSPYEAVLYDVTEGIKRYQRIEDHEAYPISVLVNRDAFLVMFPGKRAKKRDVAASAARSMSRSSGIDDDEDYDMPLESQLESLRAKFFYLASVAKSVVFARAQPAMKKKMVTEIIARVPDAITLAIGDGANDTDMITAAHVGVGIAGVEGTAATNSADYAIGTFRMLHTLLFVHGFWSYARVSNLVLFIFYKAALLAITQFIFGFYSGFSGQQFFNDMIYQLYNVMYTALPIISLAVLDKPLPKNSCEDNPAAFREQKHRMFNASVFAMWILRSLTHSVTVFFICLYALDTTTPGSDGKSADLWYFSTLVFFGISLIPTFLIFFLMQSVQLFHILAIICSILSITVVSWIVNTTAFAPLNPNLVGIIDAHFTSPSYWLTLVLAVSIPMLIELMGRFIARQFFPTFTQILQEKLAVARYSEKKMNKIYKSTHGKEGAIVDQVLPEIDPHAIEMQNSANWLHIPRPIITPEEEAAWQTISQPQRPKTQSMAEVLKAIDDGQAADPDEEQLRSALVRTMLRFRNQTGSQFDSAAQARFQMHDTFMSPSSGPVGGRNLVDGIPLSQINTLRKRSSNAQRHSTSTTGKKRGTMDRQGLGHANASDRVVPAAPASTSTLSTVAEEVSPSHTGTSMSMSGYNYTPSASPSSNSRAPQPPRSSPVSTGSRGSTGSNGPRSSPSASFNGNGNGIGRGGRSRTASAGILDGEEKDTAL